MKTLLNSARILSLLAAALGLNCAQPATAADTLPTNQPVTARVDKVDNNTYLVRVSNPSQKWSEVRLVSATRGSDMYRSRDMAPSFGRKLNLSNLEDGQYTLVVKTSQATSSFTLNLRTQAQQRTCEVSERAVAAR